MDADDCSRPEVFQTCRLPIFLRSHSYQFPCILWDGHGKSFLALGFCRTTAGQYRLCSKGYAEIEKLGFNVAASKVIDSTELLTFVIQWMQNE